MQRCWRARRVRRRRRRWRHERKRERARAAAGTYRPRRGPTRLDHVAIAVPEAAKVTPFVVGVLGARPHADGRGLGPFHWWQYRFAGGGLLELVEPMGPDRSFLDRFLGARGAGVHHVMFKVPDLRAAADRARSLGYEVLGYDDANPGWKEAFLHPKEAQGIVVQMAESRPEFGGHEGGWRLRLGAEPAPGGVSLVGLRLCAASAERARAQWAALLGGRCRAEGDELCFRWPDSPLRIVVTVDPDAEEGARCLEIAATVAPDLPEGPHSELGVGFAVVGDRSSAASRAARWTRWFRS